MSAQALSVCLLLAVSAQSHQVILPRIKVDYRSEKHEQPLPAWTRQVDDFAGSWFEKNSKVGSKLEVHSLAIVLQFGDALPSEHDSGNGPFRHGRFVDITVSGDRNGIPLSRTDSYSWEQGEWFRGPMHNRHNVGLVKVIDGCIEKSLRRFYSPVSKQRSHG